jgi:hypothetical protein
MRAEGKLIDPDVAEVNFWYGDEQDPYGQWLPVELACIGRIYVAQNPGSTTWVAFYDLPDETRARLESRCKPSLTIYLLAENWQ